MCPHENRDLFDPPPRPTPNTIIGVRGAGEYPSDPRPQRRGGRVAEPIRSGLSGRSEKAATGQRLRCQGR